MAYFVVDRDGTEKLFDVEPLQLISDSTWIGPHSSNLKTILPKGTIKRIFELNRGPTWRDEPFVL